MKKTALSLLLAAGLLSSGVALADRGYYGHGHGHGGGHVDFGFYFGPTLPMYAPYPYYYYPPVVVAPPAPPVYIEREDPQMYIEKAPQSPSQGASSGYWYHCNNPEGYYPYIKECPSGWQAVTPTPPRQ
jgi:hypothetical protein